MNKWDIFHTGKTWFNIQKPTSVTDQVNRVKEKKKSHDPID